MKIKLNLAFNYIYVIMFTLVIFGTIFFNKSLAYTEKPIILIVSSIVIFIILMFIYININRDNSELNIKKECIISILLFFIMIVVQAICLYNLKSYPAWDWNDVSHSAIEFVKGNFESVDYDYFQKFTNNHGMLYFEIILFKILNKLNHLDAYLDWMIIINMILVDLSVVITYFSVRKLLNNKNAIFSLIFMMTNIAFYNYLPILYTDTATMIFPVFAAFLYICYQKDKERNSKQKNCLIWVGIGISIAIGMNIKFTCIIMLIAIIIDIILKNKIKEFYKYIITTIISLIICTALINFFESKLNVFNNENCNPDKAIPVTHWMMMGLNERDAWGGKKFIGSYSKEAYDLTLSYDTKEERKEANIAEIKKIIFNEYGIKNYISFLYRKLLYVWSDGTYYAPLFLEENPINKDASVFKDIFYPKGKYFEYMFDENVGISILMYCMFIITAIKFIKKKESEVNFCNIGIFGMLIFFMIWESSARYLINFAPIFIIVTVTGFKITKETIDKLKEKHNKIKKLKENN